MGKFLYHPFAPLFVFAAALTAMFLTYLAAGVSPSPKFEVVATLFWSLLIAIWIVADAHRRWADGRTNQN